MNYLLGTDCIKACAHMKKEDAQINGVIVFSNKNRNGCWCTRNMTQIVDRYKTCFLKPNTSTTGRELIFYLHFNTDKINKINKISFLYLLFVQVSDDDIYTNYLTNTISIHFRYLKFTYKTNATTK